MSEARIHLERLVRLQAEESANAFAALLRQEGDQIRRDVFEMLSPGQSVSGRLQAGYTVVYPRCETRGHAHVDREEVYHFTRGSGLMIVGKEEIEVAAGDTLYIPPGAFHKTRSTSDLPLECFWITIMLSS
jgi:mannose-6-phosphate isomerase-like protein (cupin superfamily)